MPANLRSLSRRKSCYRSAQLPLAEDEAGQSSESEERARTRLEYFD